MAPTDPPEDEPLVAHLDLVARIGRELVKLGLNSRAEHLRRYLVDVRGTGVLGNEHRR